MDAPPQNAKPTGPALQTIRRVLGWLIAGSFVAAGGLFLMAQPIRSHFLIGCDSTYREFLQVGAMDEQRLRTLTPPGGPAGGGYDVVRKLRTVGEVTDGISFLSAVAATGFLLNAGLLITLRQRVARLY